MNPVVQSERLNHSMLQKMCNTDEANGLNLFLVSFIEEQDPYRTKKKMGKERRKKERASFSHIFSHLITSAKNDDDMQCLRLLGKQKKRDR